jgi:hypothetical protein
MRQDAGALPLRNQRWGVCILPSPACTLKLLVPNVPNLLYVPGPLREVRKDFLFLFSIFFRDSNPEVLEPFVWYICRKNDIIE